MQAEQRLLGYHAGKMISATLLCTLWTAVAGATQVIHKTVHIAAVGENVTLQCKLSKLYEVVQVTWQKENGKAKTNLATYSEADGSKVLGKDQSHVQISQSGLSISALTFLGVQLKDDGCYNCIFNTFPLGSIPGRTCLKVYSLTEPTLDVKRVASPDNEETELLELSCSVTGKPAPQITWKGIQPLLKKPSQSIFHHPNQTVTVVSNLTHVSSKGAWENHITCVVQHLSSNTTKELTLPGVEMEQGVPVSMVSLDNRNCGYQISGYWNTPVFHNVLCKICFFLLFFFLSPISAAVLIYLSAAQNKDLGTAVIIISVLVSTFLLGPMIFAITCYWRRLLPIDNKPVFLCQILPVHPGNVMCRRYSYTGNQVPVRPFQEGTFSDS